MPSDINHRAAEARLTMSIAHLTRASGDQAFARRIAMSRLLAAAIALPPALGAAADLARAASGCGWLVG
jgi:cyanophycinase-like exopeptidase